MTKQLENPAKAVMVSAIVRKLGGSESDAWNEGLCDQVLQTMWVKNSDQKERGQQCAGTVAALLGIAPADVVEGMIAAQMLACHHAAMESYRRAMLGDQSFEGRNMNLSHANKLSRTHAALVEALNRHKGRGPPKLSVEHLHVHAGGQAVVGNVAGGGLPPKSRKQPHALGHDRSEAMPCEIETQRETLPIASGAGA